MVLLSLFSCNEPRTVVTNIIHPDGSITRRIEMKSSENKFNTSDLQVPFDSTWIVKDSIEISNNGDTTWVKRAEKLFKNVAEINVSYRSDSGANKEIKRTAEFNKRFRWFNTEYRFTESIDRVMSYGYPVSDFLNSEELNFFYSPEIVVDAWKKSADSLKFNILEDTINHKTEQWLMNSVVSEWIGDFCRLAEGQAGADLTKEKLKSRESELVRIVQKYDQKFDSLWEKGIILNEMIGEANAIRYRKEADSAINLATSKLFISFKDYSVKMVMPGKLIGTNGFIDSSQVLLWPVKSDFFLMEPYQMWAESKTSNLWAWIITGVFLLFVATGLLIKVLRK
jgi:hypothetical protein